MGTHSNILAWKMPWTEKPGGLQSMGLQRVGYNRLTNTSLLLLERFGYMSRFMLFLSELFSGLVAFIFTACLFIL